MAKAASRSQPAPSGTSVTGIVSHPWVLRVVLAGLVMGAIAVGLLKLDSLSRRTQLQRAMESDRPLMTWLDAVKREIATPGRPTEVFEEAKAQAVWLGMIVDRELSTPEHRQPTLVALKLASAMRLAGDSGPHDGRDNLSVSLGDFHFPAGPPQKGEHWVVAVWRKKSGHNFIRDARKLNP